MTGPLVPLFRRAGQALRHAIGGEGTAAPHDDESAIGEERKRAEKAERRLRADAKQAQRIERRARAQRLAQELSSEGGAAVRMKLDYPSADLYLLVSSDMEREWRVHSCAKEPWTVAWLEESLVNGGVLYDIGANVGAFTVIAASLCAGRGVVVAFEPGYASYARLCDNVVLNHCQEAVIPVPLALGRTTGVAALQYRTLHPGQSRHAFDDRRWSPSSSGSSRDGAAAQLRQPVLSMTLDDAVERFGLPRPNHIKLDVDGAEINVLRGAVSTLALPELQSVLVEVDETLTGDVLGFMSEHGFALDRKHKRVHDELTQVWYGVFRRVQK